MDELSRYKGTLLGLAVGDALGTTLEFKPPGSFEPITDIVGGGPFHLKPGEWTDDTSMALCLTESLIDCNGFDLKDQLNCYLRWFHEGYLSSNGECFDIGNTVMSALLQFERSRNPYSGGTEPMSAGNGSIMRLAPIPLFFASNPDVAIEKSGESSRSTHNTQACVDACRYFGGLLVGAVRDVPKEKLLSKRFRPLDGKWRKKQLLSEISEVASGSFKEKNPPEIKGTGYVVRSLEAALWAFYHSDSFEEGCLMAVNLGDDADTTGAIYGQLAGAYYGEDGIPSHWLEKIVKRGLIEEYAEELYRLSQTVMKIK
jgi:ADP-ribosylglycohydrolase